jgi:hypothetical protein
VNSLGGGHERDLEIVPAAMTLSSAFVVFSSLRLRRFDVSSTAPSPAAPSAPVPLTISAEFPMRAKGA